MAAAEPRTGSRLEFDSYSMDKSDACASQLELAAPVAQSGPSASSKRARSAAAALLSIAVLFRLVGAFSWSSFDTLVSSTISNSDGHSNGAFCTALAKLTARPCGKRRHRMVHLPRPLRLSMRVFGCPDELRRPEPQLDRDSRIAALPCDGFIGGSPWHTVHEPRR